MQKVALAVFTLALFFCLIPASYAYETIPFRNGGSIEGTVEFVGTTVPPDPMLTLTSETKYCGNSLPAKKYLIKNKRIENVIVFLVGIKSGKPVPGAAVSVISRKCEFTPHVAVAFKGNKIAMKTEDPVFHTFDVHASIGGKELFHFAFPEKGASITKTLTKMGLLELSCYVHPWQHAYVHVFDHPYAVVTDERGKFAISNIPPGTYTIEAWHEALGTVKITSVKVESAKISAITVKYTKQQ